MAKPFEKIFAEATTTPSPHGRGTVSICRRGGSNNNTGSILVVAINRPKARNALSDDTYEDLLEVLERAKNDPSIAAVVWTGAGSYFCSGADVKNKKFDLASFQEGDPVLLQPNGRFMMAMVSFPKLICAAVQGPTVGIAASALLQCDLVYFSQKAFFWAPFARLSLVPELTASATLIETMGLSKANEILLLGKRVDAKTALDWGICSQVITDCDLSSGDPFHPNSLASRMCQDIDKRLLSLTNGPATAQVFCTLVKGARRSRMHQVLLRELAVLDQRFRNGEVLEAAKQLVIGAQKKKKKEARAPRSRL
ncbi:CoA delta isomerase 2, mitochondrial [Seminavis robusta]|uniref:CoA delta isomerase 2, mitochondrial n=1 Tax=Seminavis robusta TaxID=568900 RepID=A0A9N8DU55_9STRA|nr:CoA delta isomerase 2, mitochondrial [Seminavis robusta]|eukprot:Sro293_g109830.1 CoA delta isomerase 2, mitochondrial (310) ;mRNA; f:21485-22518